MSWFKLDDRFFDNPKIAVLSKDAKLAYLEAGTYCARELTDGFIPGPTAKRFAGRSLKELVPGLWEPVKDGYRVHDFLVYNPTRAQVLASKSEQHEAKARAGRAGAIARWQPDGRTNGSSMAEPMAENMAPIPESRSRSFPDPSSHDPIPEPSAPFGEEGWAGIWAEQMGPLSEGDAVELLRLAAQVPDSWVQEAISETVAKSDSAPWPYCRSILQRCIESNVPPVGKKSRGAKAAAGSARAQFQERLEAQTARG